MTLRLRRIWLQAHLILGLTLGLLLAMLGLTGSFLVFHHPIDEWLNPGLRRRTAAGPDVPLARVVAAAEAATADLRVTSRLLMPPKHAGGSLIVYATEATGPDPRDRRLHEVHVDPATARVLGRRAWGDYFVSWVYVLHSTLHGGEAGESVVGLAGVGLVLSVGTGLLLWWPILRQKGPRFALRVKAAHRAYDLHKVGGVISALALIIVGGSGVYLVFPNWFRPALATVSRLTPYPTFTNPPPPADRTDPRGVTPDRAVAEAARLFPGARFIALSLPVAGSDAYVATFRREGEVRRTWGRCVAGVDRWTGRIIGSADGSDRTAADAFAEWQFPLHNGEAGGLAGRWLVVLTGLSPTLLGITGTTIWLRKRRSRARQRRARAIPSSSPTLASAAP